MNNESCNVRFVIDYITKNGFQNMFKQKPFKEKYGLDYKYLYTGNSVDKSQDNYWHYVEITLNNMRLKFKAECSKEFIQNLKWISNIDDILSLNEIVYES